MTDYLWAKTENVQNFLDNALEKQEQELIKKFLYKIRHIPLFWVIDNDELEEVYEAIDVIRDFYQAELNKLGENNE